MKQQHKTIRGNQYFLFDKSNYKWMIIGLAVMFLGLIIMIGGKSPDPTQFNYDEIYSFRRITLAPLCIMIGLGLQAYAILRKPKEDTAGSDSVK